MQGVILAAGKGSRIAKHSDVHPKSLLKINGKTVIKTQVELFEKYGIKNIIVVVGYKKEMIMEELKDHKNIQFIYNPFYPLMNVLGSFWFALADVKYDFLFVHADTIFEENILIKTLDVKGKVVLPVEKKRCTEEDMKVRLVEDRVFEINKTMSLDVADGEFIGLAKVSKEMLPLLRKHTEQLLGTGTFNLFFESAIQELIDKEHIDIEIADITGLKWNEIDFEQDYEDAVKMFA